MKFMFTIYHDEKALDAIPENEMQALVDDAIEYAEAVSYTHLTLPTIYSV